MLVECGKNKIAVIKAIRMMTDMGLKEAKDLTEQVPSVVLQDISAEDADRRKQELENVGARVEVRFNA